MRSTSLDPPFSPRDRRGRNALWVAEHLLGQRALRGPLGRARAGVEERLAQATVGLTGERRPVPEWSGSAEQFVAEVLPAGEPVVLRGAASDWPAMKAWSPSFFMDRLGHEPVRLLHMNPEDAGAGHYDGVDTTMGEALARLEEGNAAYLRFIPALMNYPDLQAQLDVAWLKARRGPLSPPGNLHLFIGGAGTDTGLHSAVPANLFTQVHGRKKWVLYPPSASPLFRPPMERAMYFASRFDPDAPDPEAFPEACRLPAMQAELTAGDVLYNPPFWWHKVSNPTVSIGVGFRWFPPHRCWQASPTQWLLTYLSVNPPFWVGAQLKLDFTKIFTTRWAG